jgi:hypothetical protein
MKNLSLVDLLLKRCDTWGEKSEEKQKLGLTRAE